MSSDQLYKDYISNTLLTNILQFEDFKLLLDSYCKKNNISENLVKAWYSEYLENEKTVVGHINNQLLSLLKEVRSSDFLTLKKEISDTYQVEDVLSRLYNVENLLDMRLKVLEYDISSLSDKIAKFNYMLRNYNNNSNGEVNINEIINRLRKLNEGIDSLNNNLV